MISNLSDQENLIYKDIEAAVTPSKVIDADGVRSFVDAKLDEFGSLKDLPPEIKKLHELVYTQVDGGVVPRNSTYAAFNLKRREIGQAIGKKSGPFADTETGLLKEMYGAMKQQQRSIVDDAGVGSLQDAADALTIKRNAIQDSMTEVL